MVAPLAFPALQLFDLKIEKLLVRFHQSPVGVVLCTIIGWFLAIAAENRKSGITGYIYDDRFLLSAGGWLE